MRQSKRHNLKKSSSGFTLVEMAVVLVIMGLVAMTVFPALVAMRSSNQQALTQSNLHSLMLATATYVQANGCLPCPAVPGGTRANFGLVSTSGACGVCTALEGIPPFASLGIPASMAQDGWGHWITMRVDSALTNPTPVVIPPQLPCTQPDIDNTNGLGNPYGCSTVGTSIKGICKAFTPGITVTQITPNGSASPQKAAVVFVSHGSTGYGSYPATAKTLGVPLPFPSNYSSCNGPYNSFAQCNAATNNPPPPSQFYDAPHTVSDTDPYDDVLAYADRNTLVSMLGNGACTNH